MKRDAGLALALLFWRQGRPTLTDLIEIGSNVVNLD